MIFVFFTYIQKLSSKFINLDIENPLGGGFFAKFQSPLQTPLLSTGLAGRFPSGGG
jgi:hypothetical protein